jgi:hypothetical protein
MSYNHQSSKNFGDEMTIGWLGGIQFKQYSNVMEIDKEVLVKRSDGQPAGDIDALVRFSRGVSLEALFPEKRSIRPGALASSKVTCFFAEVKRSMTPGTSSEKKIRQFVQFYMKLLSLDGLEEPPGMDMRNLVDQCSHLFFVFNGVDSVTVEQKMRAELKKHFEHDALEIHGKPIVLVWVNSTEMCSWDQMLYIKKQMKHFKNTISQLTLRVDQLSQTNRQQSRQIDQLSQTNRQQSQQIAQQSHDVAELIRANVRLQEQLSARG